MANTPLFDRFTPPSAAEIEAAIEKSLRGADPASLIWEVDSDLQAAPYYRNTQETTLAPQHSPWKIRHRLAFSENTRTNKELLDLLNNGVNAPELAGLLAEELPATLEGVLPQHISLHFSEHSDPKELLNAYAVWLAEKDFTTAQITGSLDWAPLSHLSRTGTHRTNSLNDDLSTSHALIEASKHMPEFRVLHVDGSVFNDAGATLTQELAYTLAMGSELLAQLTDKGLAAKEIAANIHFTLPAGGAYFPQIAKYRAFQLLWSTVLNAYGIPVAAQTPIGLHGSTSRWTSSAKGTSNNLLRATTQAMAAAIGGCTELSVTPHDALVAASNSFSQRIARNIQLVLQEESHLGHVHDAGKGSHYIEQLTRELAASAWKLFQETEAAGGYLTELQNGNIQNAVEASAADKKAAIEAGTLAFIGATLHPDPDPVEGLLVNAPSSGANQVVKPLKTFRATEVAEREGVNAD